MNNSNFNFLVHSAILRGEKPNKGLEAFIAENPHQMNRVIGYLPDKTKVIVAQRPGKGGMDFTKLMGGKVYAVAADGLSPVFEKDSAGKPTKVQKMENGLPLYSSSGFYLLSSKDYPALELGEYYTLLRDNGAQVVIVSDSQLEQAQQIQISSELDLDLFGPIACQALDDEQNFVVRFDLDINVKRRRGLERAKEDAEEAGEPFEGPAFVELTTSKRDGNPALVAFWQVDGQPTQSALVLREELTQTDGERWVAQPIDNIQAWDTFTKSNDYLAILRAVDAGQSVTFGFIPAHVLRTSVSFRRKVENLMAVPVTGPQYGDAVYIHGALRGWCRGIVSLIHSQHPTFPNADYDAHHYVVALRQSVVGMTKKPDGTGWLPPQIVPADLLSMLPVLA